MVIKAYQNAATDTWWLMSPHPSGTKTLWTGSKKDWSLRAVREISIKIGYSLSDAALLCKDAFHKPTQVHKTCTQPYCY